jgi:uncharacterized protein
MGRIIRQQPFTSSGLPTDADGRKTSSAPSQAQGTGLRARQAATGRQAPLAAPERIPLPTALVKAFARMQRNTSTQRQENLAIAPISSVGHSLRALTRISARWPRFAMAVVILVSCACVGYTFFFLRFKTERVDLLDPAAEQLHAHWKNFASGFSQASEVTVVVEAGAADDVKHILDEIGERLKSEPEQFSNVLYKFESGPLRRKWLQYVPPQNLQIGLQRINEYAPILRGDWSPIELDHLYGRLGSQLDTRLQSINAAKPPSDSEMRRLFKPAELLTSSLEHALTNPDEFRSPWPHLVPMDTQTRALKEQVSYFLSDRQNMGYLRVVPRRDPAAAVGEWPALERLEAIDAEIAEAHTGCKIGLTGVPVLETEEMRRSRWDMAFAMLLAVGGCLTVMAVGFRGLRHPMLALVMLAASMTWALAFATAMVGHLTVLSLVAVSILLCLGIDFAIAYLARYLQLRREGWQLRPALMQTTGTTGTASMTTAVTAALAFLCTLASDHVGVAELGMITAAGIMLCALGAFFVLPALISLADRNADPNRLPHPFDGARARRGLARFPFPTLVVSAAVVVIVGLQIFRLENRRPVPRLRFDANLLNLHDQDAESVRLSHRLFDETSHPLLYAVSVTESENQMRELDARLQRLPSVGRVESLALRLPAYSSDATRQLLAQYRSMLAYLPGQVPWLHAADPSAVGKAIEDFYNRLKKYPDNEYARRTAQAADGFLNRFEKLSLDAQSRYLQQFQYRIAVDLLTNLQQVRDAANDEQIEVNDLPNELVSRFVTPPDAAGKRKWLLQIYPKEGIWDEAPLARFVSEVRSVDPHATGTPIHNYETAHQIRHGYETAALYAFALVWIVLLVDFLSREARWLALLPTLGVAVLAAYMLHQRQIPINPMLFVFSYVVVTGLIALVMDARNLRNALFAYMAPLAGGLLMLGIFALAHVALNPANLLVLPLILGIGVNYGVHVVHDYRAQKGAYQMSASVFSTVVLTAAVSIVGFGSMMIASHRGLFSLGLALSIGIASCLFVSLVLLPSLLSVVSKRESASASAGARNEAAATKRVEREAKRAA